MIFALASSQAIGGADAFSALAGLKVHDMSMAMHKGNHGTDAFSALAGLKVAGTVGTSIAPTGADAFSALAGLKAISGR